MNNDMKTRAYISYGKSIDDLKVGSFTDVPKDAFVAVITLETPVRKEDGTVEMQRVYHRKFCGNRVTASVFLDTYSSKISYMELLDIKKQVEEGNHNDLVVISDIGYLSAHLSFAFVDDRDSVVSNYDEFVGSIIDFSNRFCKTIDMQEPDLGDEVSRKVG